ncbi:MAG: tetratricopeptide repeat protein [Pseudomonadota bacterium]
MSNSDSFIEEVTEEVQRDRLWGYARRYGWVGLVAILGLVGFIAWSEYQKAQALTAAQALGDRIVAAAATEDPAERAEALAALGDSVGEAQVIVSLRQAAALVEAEKPEEALAIYKSVADSADDPIYADLAMLKAIVLQGADMPHDERIAALDGLAAPGGPFRPLALEQKALALVDADDTEGAIAILTDLIEDNDSSDGLRTRAGQLLVSIGGTISPTSRLLSGQ